MGFLDGLFEKKYDKPVAGNETIRRATAGGFARGNAWAGYSLDSNHKWGLDNALDQAYAKVVWVYRAVHTIAAAQASLELQLKDTNTPQGHIVDDKEFWRLVNKKPNPYEDAWTFRYRLSSVCLLSPAGAFIEVVRNGKNPKELYLLDPGTVKIHPSETRWVDKYEVSRANGKTSYLDPDDVIWVRTNPHPTDPYRNVTPLESAGISVETDYFARMFNRNFLKKDGRPGMLISIKGDMLAEDAEEIKNLFSGGYGSAGETRVIESEGIDVADLTTKPRDAQWSEALQSAKENILTAFGVPESVLGNASGRCLRSTELVHLADGQLKPAQELVGQKFKLMQPFDGGMRAIEAKAEYAKRETVFKITTFSGRTLEVNGEHPLFMAISREKKTASSYRGTKRDIFPYGWTPLNDIKSIFDSNDRDKRGTYTEVAVPLWFEQQYDDLDVLDTEKDFQKGSEFEEVPDYIFSSPLAAQKAFLSGVYTTHGRLSQHTGFDLYVPTREYAKRLQTLLMRVGVASYIGSKKMTHTVSISGFVNMRHFLDQIELSGKQAENAEKVRERIDIKTDDVRQEGLLRTDGLPAGMIWDRVLDIEDLGEDDTVAISIDDAQHRHYMSTFWEHNTYSNAEVEGELFWTTTMKTHCDSIASALEPLTDDTNDNVYMEFDYSVVDVLQTAHRRRMDRYKQDLASGAINMNDYRIYLGLDPIDDPFFRVYIHPNGFIGGDPADVQVVTQNALAMRGPVGGMGIGTNPFAVQTSTGGDGVVGGFNDVVQGELARSGSDHAQTVNDQAARTLRSSRVTSRPPEFANPHANADIQSRVNNLVNRKVLHDKTETKSYNDIHRDLRNKTIGFIEGSLESWSNRQLSVVSDRLSHTKVRKGTRHWDGEIGTKSLDTGYVVNVDDWTHDASETICKVVSDTLSRESKIVSNNLKDAGYKPKSGDDFVDAKSLQEIIDSINEQLVKSVARQSELVQKHIAVQDQAGFTIDEMKSTLSDPENFDRFNWISLLSKRITTFAIESMYDKLYSNIDAKVTKTWRTHPNEAFRDTHAKLDDVQVEITDEFDTESGKIRFPAGILSSEGDNCACWLVYGVEK